MPTPRRSWLLIVSLCVNVALVGGIAMIAWRIAHIDTSVGSGGPLAPHSVMREFPDRQAAIQKAIDAHRETIVALRHAAWQARIDAFGVLGAADYSPQRMSAALKTVAAADAALELQSVVMMGDSFSALSAADRQALVDRVNRRNRSWLFKTFLRKSEL